MSSAVIDQRAFLLLCVTSQAWKVAQEQKEDDLNKKGKKGKKEEEVAKVKEKEPSKKEEEKKKAKASPVESVVQTGPPAEESSAVQPTVESPYVRPPFEQLGQPESLQINISFSPP